MLAGMLARMVAILVDKHSFYDHLKHQYTAALDDEDAKAEASASVAQGFVNDEVPVTPVNNSH